MIAENVGSAYTLYGEANGHCETALCTFLSNMIKIIRVPGFLVSVVFMFQQLACLVAHVKMVALLLVST